MNVKIENFLQRFIQCLRGDRGQVLPWVAFMMMTILGMGGFAADTGRAYFYYRQLQASTDAAALAAAEALPSTSASTAASSYGAVSGGANAIPGLTVTMPTGYPLLECLTTLKNAGMACSAPANANAVQVKQTATLPMYFISMLGIKTVTMSAVSTASMRGSAATPYNVAIIVDTTQSMNDTDSDSQCSTTRISCALSGVKTLLSNLDPCSASLSSCGTVTQTAGSSTVIGSGTVSNSVDRVALFVFPNPTMNTAIYDYDCSSTNPTNIAYTFPSTTGTTYAPSGSGVATYEVIGFSSDYRTSDTSTSLSSTSYLSKAVGGATGCASPMTAVGGEGTYYAGVIYAAQAALVAAQKANSGSQNVMIIISDGDASASSSQLNTSASGYSATSGTYPSQTDQCGQAVVAAKAATTAGTHVYTVAYGAEASGCSTDTSGTYKGITPCQTMQDMASAPQYFFSDYTATGGTSSCISASQPTTNLNQIFVQIAGDLTVSRLIPNGTT